MRKKKVLNDVKEMSRHWKFKEEAPDLTLWGTCLGRG
jgi:hypothetical protein